MRLEAACALALLLAAPAPVLARDTLPWKDANPVDRAAPRHKAKPHTRKAEAPKTAASDPDVPLPEARPAAPADPAPEPASDKSPAPPPAAEAAKPEPRPADAPKPDASKPEATKPDAPAKAEPDAAAAPTDAATLPLNEIPVPDKRPAPAAGETAPPKPSDTPPPVVAPVPTPEPVPPAPPAEEAPNSTEKLKAREPEVTPAAAVEAAAAVEDSIACEAELKKRGAEFTVEETISEGECGVLRPVALKRLSSGIEVTPRTQMLCRTALALDEWMSDSVVPAAKADLPTETLSEFRHASTYVCRPRASENGISEHARGSAIDIGGFVFKSGREIGVAAKEVGSPDEKFLETVRQGACGPFKTVLGPGTDKDHATHFHLDIAARKNGATYCK